MDARRAGRGSGLEATGLQTRLKTTGADGRRVRRSGAGRVKRDAEARSAAPFPDRLGPSSVSSSARGGPPDRKPDGGGVWGGGARYEGVVPRRTNPKACPFPCFQSSPGRAGKAELKPGPGKSPVADNRASGSGRGSPRPPRRWRAADPRLRPPPSPPRGVGGGDGGGSSPGPAATPSALSPPAAPLRGPPPLRAPSAPPPDQSDPRPPGSPPGPLLLLPRPRRLVPSPGEMVSISTPIAVPPAPPPRVPAAAATPARLRPRPARRPDSPPRRHCRAGGGAAGVGTCAGRGHGEGDGGAGRRGKVGSAGAGPWRRRPDAAPPAWPSQRSLLTP